MAKDPSKTEKATPRRRQKAREEGQVLKSQDVPIFLSLVFTSMLFFFYLPFVFNNLRGYLRYSFMEAASFEEALVLLTLFKGFLIILIPIFTVLLFVGVFANVLQFGFLFTLKPLVPKLDNLNVVKGLGRVFSIKTIFETIKNTFKLLIAIAVAYVVLGKAISDFYSLTTVPFQYQVYLFAKWIIIVLAVFALLSAPIALADYLYRRWEYEENLKMSKQEVKEERKQYEGHPLIKSAIRKKQREIAMRRMMAEVPKADVVITNPTHYAVALKYERGKMHAPKVVAKGVDKVALKIKEIALEHGVPVEENPELARALYTSCEIGDYIPEEFYRIVAKILAKIYRRRRSF